MKKTLISVLVLLATTAVASPVVASPREFPIDSVHTNQGQARLKSTHFLAVQHPKQQPQDGAHLSSVRQNVRQSQPLTVTANITATTNMTATAPLTQTLLNPAAAAIAAEITGTLSLTETVDGLANEAVDELNPLDDPALDALYTDILSGTIIANRTSVPVRFFVEGRTYEVAPLRAIGLELLRNTAVLNLFNCDAAKSDADVGCFWDPYLLTRDNFYEVVIGQQLGQDVLLSLRSAGAPPTHQIWIQNRTGERQTVIVNNELHEIAPAAVSEFSVQPDGTLLIQLRTCIRAGERAVCEWTPQGAETGFYYGLYRTETPGPNNTLIEALTLQAIIGPSGETIQTPPQAFCRLRVPTLNVRSGPGLEFPIIAKIRGTETEPGSVVVVAFDATKTWMQVTERVARDGWVTANPEFILCDEGVANLPVVGQLAAAATPVITTNGASTAAEISSTPPAATAPPAPATDTAATQPSAPVPPSATEAIPEEQTTPTPEPAAVPDGLARIIVNNGFDQKIRFTLDQQYRPERDNLSGEWDLEPGDSVTILVYPGTIAFSVSTAWRGLSGNAELVLAEKEERALWLYFVPDPLEPDRWNLQY
jgi:hypothetical protein